MEHNKLEPDKLHNSNAVMSSFIDDESLFNVQKDPSSADALLAKEMMALDLKERTALQEEAHGFLNPFFDETPEKIATAMKELMDKIDRIPPSDKKMFLHSQTVPNSHIQTKAFRLRMLRSAGFNIHAAATRLVELCDIMVDLFGEVALQRPIRIADFSKKELQVLRLGRYQFLPFGDRMGRRIMAHFCDEVWEAMDPRIRAKIGFYMSWVSALDDETQRRGSVVIVWFDKEYKQTTTRPVQLYPEHKLHSVRVAAIHMCTPDTPQYRIRRAVVMVRLGRSRRLLRVHVGNSIENRYALQSFGIASDQLPISYTGKIKLGYVRQWMGVRRIIESKQQNIDLLSRQEILYEFPKQNDVVFRQGSACTHHSANTGFRNLIISKVREQERSKEAPGEMKIRRKKIVLDVVNEVRAHGKGRFLVWNENGGWNELLDDEIIHSKIEYLIKEFRKTIRSEIRAKPMPQTVLSASTSVFRSNYTMVTDHNPALPLDLQHQVDQNDLLEAASCVVNCFNLNENTEDMSQPQQEQSSSFW